jgi:predicted transcriptional regulator
MINRSRVLIISLSLTERKILHLLEHELKITSPVELAKKLGLNVQHIRNLVANLAKHEYLRRVVRGAYEIGKKGKAFLDQSSNII